MLLRTALLVVAASAQQQAYVDPHGAAGEPLAGDLNGDGVLDEYELQQIEQATKSLTESFRAQVRQQLASQYVAQKTGGSKLADSRIASQAALRHTPSVSPAGDGSAASAQAAGLQFAAANNQLEVVARLLASGADRTPTRAAPQPAVSLARALLLGADPNANHPSGMGLTPLHAAVEGGHKDLVDLLLEHNATIDARASDGSTPLHVAARKGHAAVAELLLRRGAPVGPSPHARRVMDVPWTCQVRGAGERRGGGRARAAAPRGRDIAEMQPRCSRDAAEMQPRCSRDAAEMQPRHGWARRRCSLTRPRHVPQAEMGHSVVVQYLLAANASADARAQDGRTPRHFHLG